MREVLVKEVERQVDVLGKDEAVGGKAESDFTPPLLLLRLNAECYLGCGDEFNPLRRYGEGRRISGKVAAIADSR